jgi:hypothetical protein
MPQAPVFDSATMTRQEFGARLEAWQACRAERQADGYDFINSVAAARGMKVCVPRSQYPAGFVPGSGRDQKVIAQADSGYPALNRNNKGDMQCPKS